MNFDQLPTKKGNAFDGFEPGLYRVKVEAADMKVAKNDPEGNPKPDYLQVRLGVMSDNGARIGAIFDNITESDHPLVRYKTRRFIEACQIELEGEFELKDLTKILVGKELYAYVKVQENAQYGDRLVVDIGPDEIYLPLNEAEPTQENNAEVAPADANEVPFEPDMVANTEGEAPEY
jgi:hypothetical protein